MEPKIQEVLLGHLRAGAGLWNKTASEPIYAFLPALLFRSSVPQSTLFFTASVRSETAFSPQLHLVRAKRPSRLSEEWCEHAPRATLWVCTTQLDEVPLREYTTDKARIESKSMCGGAMRWSIQHSTETHRLARLRKDG